MVIGILIASIIFVVWCFIDPLYVEYLIWHLNGGIEKVLDERGYTSFQEFYSLKGKYTLPEVLHDFRGTCVVSSGGEEAHIVRERIIRQHVLITENVTYDPEFRYPLSRLFYLEQKGLTFDKQICLTGMQYWVVFIFHSAMLALHRWSQIPLDAYLVIPEGMKVSDLSLLKDVTKDELVITTGNQSEVEYFASSRKCRAVPVKIIL